MRLIKQEMHITNTLKPQQTKMTPRASMTATADKLTPDAKGRIIIQEGDTLWQLSRTYQVSVDQPREWNHLSSDLIMTGLRLKVAEPLEAIEGKPEQVKASTKSTVPITKNDTPNIFVHETPRPATESDNTAPSETTHILSIAPPQSESHESP
jgi:LysM repeat protein